MNRTLAESIKIEKIIPGGQGIGTLASGKKVLLWNVLPGEIVKTATITKDKSHYCEGIALEFLETSPRRIAPIDDCFLATSPFQIMSYPDELQLKAELLEETLRQHSLATPNSLTVQTDSRELHYRNKMEYTLYFDHADQQIHLAFHARGSHRKILIDHSSLERPAILAAAEAIVAELNAEHADARQYQSLLLRANQADEVSGGLFENHRPHPTFKKLSDTILGQTYTYSPNGFFQINLPVYELALQAIRPWIKTDQVLDLYAGVGTIGLSVARDHALTLVECDHSAYAELEQNVQRLPQTHQSRITTVLAKSEDALSYLAPDQTVIVDPPRAGCHPNLINRLLTVAPPTIIYLSCNPATQARDVKLLSDQYAVQQIQPFNFFPRTPHLENLIILEHKVTSSRNFNHLGA